MNAKRRKELNALYKRLETLQIAISEAVEPLCEELSLIRDAISDIESEEQETFDNMPEGLQNSERGQISQDAINAMASARDDIDNKHSTLEEFTGGCFIEALENLDNAAADNN